MRPTAVFPSPMPRRFRLDDPPKPDRYWRGWFDGFWCGAGAVVAVAFYLWAYYP